MTKRRDKRGRRKGSRTKGYFYRSGRGWFTKDKAGAFVALTNEAGERLRDQNIPEAEVKKAHARYIVTDQPKPAAGAGVTVEEVCDYYLKHAERERRASTYKMRADTLFDFCYGLSPRWREKSESQRAKLTKEEKIHPGYGSMAAADLRRHHLETWLDAHKGWTDRRTRLQAVRRALNHAVDDGLITSHGIEKFRVPQGRARVTYLSPEQERALITAARPAFKLVLRVLIRTGMRPGELAKLTPSHVIDSGTRIELRFEGEESKNGKVRSVKITDSALIELIRSQANMNGPGPIFRSESGKPWKVHYMSQSFRRVKKRVAKAGMKFDADTCIYSCRHTFAKRSLLGYWTGKPINMDMLAALMGNTPEVCRKHYADILKALDGVEELLWAAC